MRIEEHRKRGVSPAPSTRRSLRQSCSAIRRGRRGALPPVSQTSSPARSWPTLCISPPSGYRDARTVRIDAPLPEFCDQPRLRIELRRVRIEDRPTVAASSFRTREAMRRTSRLSRQRGTRPRIWRWTPRPPAIVVHLGTSIADHDGEVAKLVADRWARGIRPQANGERVATHGRRRLT